MEIVAQELVGGGCLFGRGLERGMRVEQSHGGQPAPVGDAQDSHPAVMVGHVGQKPVDGVVGVGALVDGLRVALVARVAQHHKPALGAVAPANILKDEDVALRNEFLITTELPAKTLFVVVQTVRRPLEDEGQRLGRVLRRVDFGVQADAVAHGDHHVSLLENLAEIRPVLAGLRRGHEQRQRGGQKGDRQGGCLVFHRQSLPL